MPLSLLLTADTSTEDTIKDAAREIVKNVKPTWVIDELKFKTYNDGITNKLMGVWHTDFSHQVLIRIYGENTGQFINRDAEKNNMILLHKNGCAPPLHASFSNGLCYDFVAGTPFTTKCVTETIKWISVAQEMAKLHSIKLENESDAPQLFPLLRKLLQLVPEKFENKTQQKRLDDLNYTKEYLNTEISSLESYLTTLNSPIVLCHNDALLANIIWNNTTNKAHFIDYEYASANYQAYDIGNHFSEFAGVDDLDYSLYPSKEVQLKWIRCYLSSFRSVKEDDVPDSDVELFYKLANKFALACHLLWGVWAILQAHWSSIDFDFLKFGTGRLNEYRRRKDEFMNL